jgi:NitT/TauT family transport system substrate-binding protein
MALERTPMHRRIVSGLAAALVIALSVAPSAVAAPKTSFRIAWSIYVGWMPWPYAAESGILKKWADKYGVKIELVEVNDYVESINQYTAGAFDGVALTNMDCLTIPSAGGIDTTAIVVGDYSNGNDAVILKRANPQDHPTLADIAKRKVNLVELSVSQYLLARGLDTVHLSERDITLVNTSDADIVGAFGTRDVGAVVTWNPQVSEILKNPLAEKVFDSSRIPGEIIDMMAVKTAALKDNPNLAKALAGAWYEAMATMSGSDAASQKARAQMAADSGTDLAGFDHQLTTTKLFTDPAEAVAFTDSPTLARTMDLVRTFSFDHGLLGEGAPSADVVGIQFPGGETLGDKGNIKLRFDDEFMKLAAEHKL